MDTMQTNYNFNLFKPRNRYGRRISNIIISMLIIWAVAVFGFQILLKIYQKPTPETTYVKFMNAWQNVQNATFSEQDVKDVTLSLVLISGKSNVKEENKKIIRTVISYYTYSVLSDSFRNLVIQHVSSLLDSRKKLEKAKGAEYLQLQQQLADSKKEIMNIVGSKLGISSGSIEEILLPYCLISEFKPLTLEEVKQLPQVVRLYTTHNQSFLTNTRFLGFPFHYFYTAIFLLVLFVSLCWIYCIRVERLQIKFGIIED